MKVLRANRMLLLVVGAILGGYVIWTGHWGACAQLSSLCDPAGLSVDACVHAWRAWAWAWHRAPAPRLWHPQSGDTPGLSRAPRFACVKARRSSVEKAFPWT